jgi:hypothetical protein
MRSRYLRSRLAAVLVATAALVLGTGAISASAAPSSDPLEYSTDGASWSPVPPSTLFDPSFRLSPGDTIHSVLYIRSTRSEPITLSAGIDGVTSDNTDLSRALTISASVQGSAGVNSTLDKLTTCSRAGGTTITQGQAVPISVALALSPSLKGAQAQKARVAFDLNLDLSDVGAPIDDPGCDKPSTSIPAFDGNSPFRLAFTGTDSLVPSLIIAAVVFGVGCLFVLLARRRRESRNEQ